MKKLIVLFLFLVVSFAQFEDMQKVKNEDAFFIDVINTVSGEKGQAKLDIYLQIPYTTLQFINAQNKYIAKYSATIVILDKNTNEVINSENWESSVSVDSYEFSVSKKSYYIDLKSFNIKPGSYQLKVILDDVESNKSYTVDYNIIAFEQHKELFLSDLLIIEDEIQSSAGTQYIPNISRKVTSDRIKMQFLLEVNSDTARSIDLDFRVTDKNNAVIFENKIDRKLLTGKNIISIKVDSLAFSIGTYNIQLKTVVNGNIFTRQKSFASYIAGLPNSITDLDQAVKQLVYITTNNQIDFIEQSKDYKEKLEKFTSFWKSKDPDPATEVNEILVEYYNRVNYANKRFKGIQEGWRTDMGMIYITLGPPDNVDRYPSTAGTKPYEIWQYSNLNRSFLFVDITGFGEYRLQNQNVQDWSTYRQY